MRWLRAVKLKNGAIASRNEVHGGWARIVVKHVVDRMIREALTHRKKTL